MLTAATEKGETVDTLIDRWASSLTERNLMTEPRYYETDDWFRHLGASEEMIQEATDLADKQKNP